MLILDFFGTMLERVEPIRPSGHSIEGCALEVCSIQIRALQERIEENGLTKVCPSKVGLFQVSDF